MLKIWQEFTFIITPGFATNMKYFNLTLMIISLCSQISSFSSDGVAQNGKKNQFFGNNSKIKGFWA